MCEILSRLVEHPASAVLAGARLVSGLDWSARPDLRRLGVGASEAAAALGLDDYTGPLQLWRQKRGDADPPDLSADPAIRHGHEGERYLLRIAAELGCPEPAERQVLAGLPEHPNLHATLDAVTADGEPIECKTAKPLSGWAVALAESVKSGIPDAALLPDRYRVQVQQQMLLSGARRAHVLVAVWGTAEAYLVVERDDAMLGRMVEGLGRFWAGVVEGRPPRATGPDLDLLRLVRPGRKVVELPASCCRDADELAAAELEAADIDFEINRACRDLKARKAEADRRASSCRARLYQAVGDAEVGVLPDGRKVEAPWKTRKSYTVGASEKRGLSVKGRIRS